MKIGILGCGAYGLALGLTFFQNGNSVHMWTKFEKEKELLEKTRRNDALLPGVFIPEEIQITASLEEVCLGKDILVIAIPSEFVCSVSKEIQAFLKDQVLLLASKGIEQETCLFLDEVLAKHHDVSRLCVMAGGTFARDIVKGNPVGLTLASKNRKALDVVQDALENDYFKLQATDDLIGVEICSSLKNVLALATGMLSGMGVSESTKAMFLVEGLEAVIQVMKHLGGDERTIFTFAGFGDFILTCTSPTSRNFSFGEIFVTKSKEEIKQYKETHTIEGLYTLESIHQLLLKEKVSVPLIDCIYDVIFHGSDPSTLLCFQRNDFLS